MAKEHVTLAVQRAGPTRTEVLMGQAYRVVPAVLVRSQVLHNNLGRTFLPASAITPEWARASNDAPVVLDHPTSRGRPLSARDPAILNSMGTGRLYRVRVENGELKGDVFVDESRAESLPEVAAILAKLDAGEPVELSTGFPVGIERVGGVHNGREYDLTIHPTGPLDHLAVFAEKTGACSVGDGCGMGVNCNCGGTHVEPDTQDPPAETMPEDEDRDEAANAAPGWVDRLIAAITGKAANANPKPDETGDTDPEGGDIMNREQMIAQLAANGPLCAAELAKLSDDGLRALAGNSQPSPTGPVDNQQDPDDVAILQDRVQQLRREKERLEAETRTALQAEKKERQRLIEEIIFSQNATAFADEEIRNMDVVQLRKLHSVACPPRRDFSGRGGPTSVNGPTRTYEYVQDVSEAIHNAAQEVN